MLLWMSYGDSMITENTVANFLQKKAEDIYTEDNLYNPNDINDEDNPKEMSIVKPLVATGLVGGVGLLGYHNRDKFFEALRKAEMKAVTWYAKKRKDVILNAVKEAIKKPSMIDILKWRLFG